MSGAKASIRYIQHRPVKEEATTTRTLFGRDGAMGRHEAYRMIDEAEKGSVFFRFVLSPDPKQEDTQQDLHLRAITEQTMQNLEDRLHQSVSWVAVEFIGFHHRLPPFRLTRMDWRTHPLLQQRRTIPAG